VDFEEVAVDVVVVVVDFEMDFAVAVAWMTKVTMKIKD
jgi:hypothetical protein